MTTDEPIAADPFGPDSRESEYLARAYAPLGLDDRPMRVFLDTVIDALVRHAGLSPDQAVLDIGCGRGYLLERLRRLGYRNLTGIDPCAPLRASRVFADIAEGGFGRNPYVPASFDLVIACHTLHHLPDPRPIAAVREMLLLSRSRIAIVEVNNTNLPCLALSVLQGHVERNAWRYNAARVSAMVTEAGGVVLHRQNLPCGYLSGDGPAHRIAARLGTPPYNIVIARQGPR